MDVSPLVLIHDLFVVHRFNCQKSTSIPEVIIKAQNKQKFGHPHLDVSSCQGNMK